MSRKFSGSGMFVRSMAVMLVRVMIEATGVMMFGK